MTDTDSDAGAASSAGLAWGRRAPRHVVAGAAVMTVCALLFAVVAFRAEEGREVLMVARPVAAGQVVTEADLQSVRVASEAPLGVVAQRRRSEVVGRTAAVPLAAGSVLVEEQLGARAWPPEDRSVVALPVPRVPAGVDEGARVRMVPAESGQETGGAEASAEAQDGGAWSGVVVALRSQTAAGVVSVSVMVHASVAGSLAGVGEVVLVLDRPEPGRGARTEGGR